MNDNISSKKIITVPNILSSFRIVLAFVFMWVYSNAQSVIDYYIADGIIVVSGITDCLDGKIARKFNQISELGKILDPISDKITQGILVLCLIEKYSLMLPLFILFIIKECYMGIAGMIVLKKCGWNEGAKWYGKINTVVLYVVMIILLLFPSMPVNIVNILIAVCGFTMLFALAMYIHLYINIIKEVNCNK